MKIENPFNLYKKNILVTGASSGIGRSIAIESAKMGADIIMLGRNEDRLKETMSKMPLGNHKYFVCDLTKDETLKDFFDSCPCLDGIVHSAGVGLTLPFKFTTEDEMHKIMKINFYAPVLLTQRLLKLKKIASSSSIVYLSSIDGPLTGHIGDSIYASSKSALVGMAKSLAVELAPRKIRVNCILPGRVETPLIKRNNISEEQVLLNKQLYPLKRYAKPEEIAYYAIYLLSDVSSFTTGSSLVIDGGFSLL